MQAVAPAWLPAEAPAASSDAPSGSLVSFLSDGASMIVRSTLLQVHKPNSIQQEAASNVESM